jgi:small subunit ribosomal protein S6e
VARPRRLGPKRASKIRALFALEKTDNVVEYAKSFKRQIDPKEDKNKGKHRFKYPKVQRLVTPSRLQNKRALVAGKRHRAEKQRDLKAAYATLLAQRAKERGEEKIARKERLSSTRKSGSSDK